MKLRWIKQPYFAVECVLLVSSAEILYLNFFGWISDFINLFVFYNDITKLLSKFYLLYFGLVLLNNDKDVNSYYRMRFENMIRVISQLNYVSIKYM